MLCHTIMQWGLHWTLTMGAEGVGFEPTVGYPTLDFESSALNRTQPPFLEAKKRRTPNVEQPRLNATAVPSVEGDADGVSAEFGAKRQLFRRTAPQKCYNFKLAMPARCTASCVSTRTATLLLVVDSYSQVLSAAVHEYAQLIRNLNPPLRP